MWFSRAQFEICSELKSWGLETRFEPGDLVARGFADLGYEEFQVLPGTRLLSLTAGTNTPLPEEHRHHFFWIPSIDESVSLLEQAGVTCLRCDRIDAREWNVEAHYDGDCEVQRARSLHEALLSTVREVYKSRFKKSE
jgi:hypothetical protein